MNYFYKILTMSKILLAYKKQKTFLPVLPVRLWIESSLACNLSCVMCANNDISGQEKGIMDLQLFKKIIDEAQYFVNDINIHHRGEPLINPHLADMISYSKQAGLKVRFHTNATMLDINKAKEIIEAKPDLISISFDGFTKEVYEEVRRGASFEKTLSNIKSLLAFKFEKDYRLPYMIVERIELKEYSARLDSKAIEELTKTFKDWGIDEVVTKKEYAWVTPTSEILQTERHYSVCTFPWYAMVICWDGTVAPCPQDYMAVLKMGNIQEQSIKEIWNGSAYIKLRRDLILNKPFPTVCGKCDRLCRKKFAGLPFQYMVPFLIDNFAGYGAIRRLIGSGERNG